MRVGIIGFGRAGRVHLEAWRAVPGVDVRAVADPAPGALDAVRAAGLRATAEPAALLEMDDLDAVSVCTPPSTHAPLAIAALDRGLDVLCEKPLATREDAARRMLGRAARRGRHLLLATKFRHVADVVTARDLIAAGVIGEPLAFEVDFSSRVDMAGRWNTRPAEAGGGVIIDNGCHAFDLVAFLLGPVTRVAAVQLKPARPLAVEDSAVVMAELDDGLVGRIDLSWSIATQRDTYAMVHGTAGSIDLGWRQSRLRLAGRPARPLGAGRYDRHECHAAMMRAFVEVVAGRRRPWVRAAESLRTVEAVDAAYRALRTGAWVAVGAEKGSGLAARGRMRA